MQRFPVVILADVIERINVGVEYKLADKVKKEKFDLGRGNWGAIFDTCKFIDIRSTYKNQSELSEYIELALKGRDCDNTYIKMITKRLWDWSEGRTLFFGNDCADIFDEKEEMLLIWEYKETGTVYG